MLTFKCYWIFICLCLGYLAGKGQVNARFDSENLKANKDLPKEYAILEGKIEMGEPLDSIEVMVWEYCPGSMGRLEKTLLPTLYSAKVDEDRFKFLLQTRQPVHYYTISAYNNKQKVISLEQRLIEPGDDQLIELKDDTVTYKGNGSYKNRYLAEIAWMKKYGQDYPLKLTQIRQRVEDIKYNLDYYTEVQKIDISVLEKYKQNISTVAYNILRADIIGETEAIRYRNGSMYFTLIDTQIRRTMLNLYEKELYNKKTVLLEKIPTELLGLSAHYSNYILNKISGDKSFEFWRNSPTTEEYLSYYKEQKGNKEKIDGLICNSFGLMRDKLMLERLTQLRLNGEQENINYALKRSVENASVDFFKKIFNSWNQMYSKGAEVLDFDLVDKDGKHVKLSDFRGKVVFIDMWFTGCGACQIVAKAMPEVEAAFEGNEDIVFLSISIDKDKEKWLKSITKNVAPEAKYYFAGKHYAGERSIYLYTNGRGSDDTFIKRYVPSGYPMLLIVDREGKIYSGSPSRPSPSNIEDLVKELTDALEQ